MEPYSGHHTGTLLFSACRHWILSGPGSAGPQHQVASSWGWRQRVAWPPGDQRAAPHWATEVGQVAGFPPLSSRMCSCCGCYKAEWCPMTVGSMEQPLSLFVAVPECGDDEGPTSLAQQHPGLQSLPLLLGGDPGLLTSYPVGHSQS